MIRFKRQVNPYWWFVTSENDALIAKVIIASRYPKIEWEPGRIGMDMIESILQGIQCIQRGKVRKPSTELVPRLERCQEKLPQVLNVEGADEFTIDYECILG